MSTQARADGRAPLSPLLPCLFEGALPSKKHGSKTEPPYRSYPRSLPTLGDFLEWGTWLGPRRAIGAFLGREPGADQEGPQGIEWAEGAHGLTGSSTRKDTGDRIRKL